MTNHHPTKAEIQVSIDEGISLNRDRSERESYIKSEAEKFYISVDEYRRKYEKAEIRASFKNIKNTPDRLQEESDIAREAKRLRIPVDEYRRYYELRKEKSFIQELPPKGFHPFEWGKYLFWWLIFQKLPLSWRAILKNTAIIGATITAVSTVTGAVQYVRDTPQRQKQAHYEAWKIINSAKVNEGSSAGRVDALEELVKDNVSLERLDVSNAHLSSIKLSNAKLSTAKLKDADLTKAKLKDADLTKADLTKADLTKADLTKADLKGANLVFAKLNGTNLEGADISGADIGGASFDKATNITPEQIKKALYWQEACYDSGLLKKLEISQSPLCGGTLDR
jgi:BTB/POZ domain-containing protein KCTD9